MSTPDVFKELSTNSRKLAETTYDKDILCEEFSKIVKNN